ncbi:dihydrofolate reductase family protein [Gordonia zhaorongruii]|uniref:dihydrofolate reductase family protein n=1 Tax=Gordonia zhaorongruii TaxID=2597659 RepID=UPI0010476B97|nr:dihydrofolate reductase family protein [Gordonia zhaorongruii]
MFLLHKATDVTAPEIRELFSYPGGDEPTVRATMVASLDGSATVQGLSGVLGGPGDKQVFSAMRELADAIVVGASTAIAEGYRVPDLPEHVVRERTRAERPPVPVLVLVSRSLRIDTDFTTAVSSGTLIATCSNAPHDARERLAAAGANLVDCGDDDVDPSALVRELAARGLTRIACEGGPRLLASLAAGGVLDQLVLTVSPTLVGGDGPRITHGTELPVPDQDLRLPLRLPYPMRVRRLLGDDDGYLYLLTERVTG